MQIEIREKIQFVGICVFRLGLQKGSYLLLYFLYNKHTV